MDRVLFNSSKTHLSSFIAPGGLFTLAFLACDRVGRESLSAAAAARDLVTNPFDRDIES
jgi:hypothetical protein